LTENHCVQFCTDMRMLSFLGNAGDVMV